jgi:hypothetical protein
MLLPLLLLPPSLSSVAPRGLTVFWDFGSDGCLRQQPRRVRDLLKFPRLKENAPRKGFVDDTAYGKLMGKAKELWLRGLFGDCLHPLVFAAAN